MMDRRAMLVLAGMLVACAAGRAGADPAGLVVSDPWARATPPGATTAVVYLTLRSPAGDRLVGVSTPVAASATVHREIDDHGVMRMRPVDGGLALPPGMPVTLSPGGLHIMLEGLRQGLVVGTHFPLRLEFAHAPSVEVQVAVQPIGAAMGGMGMEGMGR